MYYSKYKPSSTLDSYIEFYFIWDSKGPIGVDLIIESPPNGFCSIIFNYGDEYTLQNKKYQKINVPRQYIAGQSIYSHKIYLQGNIGIAGIVFKPAAIATIFQLPVYKFTEERIDLYTIFKKELIDKIIVQIKSAANNKERVQFLESFIMDQYYLKKPEPDYIDKAANFIVENNGMFQVADVLKDCCVSRRTFERKFYQKVGLSPKYYARIHRIGYICNLISGQKKADWRELFYECQFYDQAHFIKDFEEFTGRTPQQYINENNGLPIFMENPTKRLEIN